MKLFDSPRTRRFSTWWNDDGGQYLFLAASSVAFCLLVFSALQLTPSHLTLSSFSPNSNTTVTSTNMFAYRVLPGFFMQDDERTSDGDFDFILQNFGLIDRAYETDDEFDPDGTKTLWQKFNYYVEHLAASAPEAYTYKLLFLGRHGEGWHNVAEAYYGTEAWDDHWSKLDGNGTIVWADAHLTDTGIEQARRVHDFWRVLVDEHQAALPQSYYTSPLHRCLQTAHYSFSDDETDESFTPMVKELLRETLGVHTCDRRSSRSAIEQAFPAYSIEPGFAETDQLWDAQHRETDEEQVARMRTALDDIFQHDDQTVISCTTHSGAISFLLEALGHRRFGLATGAVIPVLVEARAL